MGSVVVTHYMTQRGWEAMRWTCEGIAANTSIPDDLELCSRGRFGIILPALVMGVWPPGVYFFGCVIAPVTGARGAFLRLGRAVTIDATNRLYLRQWKGRCYS